jgi:hypothetical protein
MTEAKHSPLLPCPFCGSPARDDLLPHPAGPGWVQCSECECDQRMSYTVEEAVMRWNTRVTPSAPAQQAQQDVPIAWISFAENGNIRFWTGDKMRATAEMMANGHNLRPFTLAELVALVSKLPSQSPAEIATEDELATELYAAEYDRDAYPFASQSSAEQLTYRAQARAILSKFDVWRRK